jgi:hypothetical protein
MGTGTDIVPDFSYLTTMLMLYYLLNLFGFCFVVSYMVPYLSVCSLPNLTVTISVADPDAGSSAFLTPGSGVRDG